MYTKYPTWDTQRQPQMHQIPITIPYGIYKYYNYVHQAPTSIPLHRIHVPLTIPHGILVHVGNYKYISCKYKQQNKYPQSCQKLTFPIAKIANKFEPSFFCLHDRSSSMFSLSLKFVLMHGSNQKILICKFSE